MKINQIKAGVILTYLTMGLGIGISLIYTPLMLRILPQGEYGLYTVAQSIIGYLSLLSFGLNSSYVKFYFVEKRDGGAEGVKNLNGCFLLINTFICVISAIAGVIIVIYAPDFFKETMSPYEINLSRKLLSILLVNLALSFPFSVFSSYVTAHEKFILLKLVRLIHTISSPFVSLVFLVLGYGSVGMVAATTGINITSELFLLFYCVTKLSFRACIQKIRLVFFKEVFVFSFFVFLQSITDQINWSIGSIVLGKVSGTVTVAIYGLASQLNNYFRQFSTAISTVYAPKINQLVSSGTSDRDISAEYTRVSKVQFRIVMFILTGFILWGSFFVSKWGGPEYEGSYIVAVVLMLAVTPAMYMNIGIEIRRAKNKHKIPSIAMLITSIANLIMTIPMSMQYGAVGAAAATLIASYANSVFLSWYYHKHLGMDMIRHYIEMLKLLPAVLLATAAGYGLTRIFTVSSYMTLLASIMIYTCIYWLFQYFIATDKSEKKSIRNMTHLFKKG